MNNSIFGSQQQNSSSKPSEVEDPLYSTIIANIVFNVCRCYPTIMLNILTIHALRKTTALSKPLKTFLLSLAVSDLGVGLLGQPLKYCLSGRGITKQSVKSYHPLLSYCDSRCFEHCLSVFVFYYHGPKYRKIHCHSDPTTIPRYCDSKTSCCSGHHDMAL